MIYTKLKSNSDFSHILTEISANSDFHFVLTEIFDLYQQWSCFSVNIDIISVNSDKITVR